MPLPHFTIGGKRNEILLFVWLFSRGANDYISLRKTAIFPIISIFIRFKMWSEHEPFVTPISTFLHSGEHEHFMTHLDIFTV